jgi:hypothetical protein
MVTRCLIRLFSLVLVFSSVVAAQSTAPRKDIPAIAKAAKEAIVTIVMADNDKPVSLGTGFLARPDGSIITNYHVIQTGTVAIVKFADGTTLRADGVLGADKVRDLAIIKIHGRTFRTLSFGNSDQVEVGEEVVAIGNPKGYELTVSNGILSGIRNDEKAGGKFLQITVPITHGSSGGPLFNMAGTVIGITTLGFEGSGNLNFAIPINDAKRLLSNQSSELQSLPNEPTPVDAEQADQAQPATMEQQKMCAEQAEQVFRKRSADGPSFHWISYTSHYNTAKGVCFVEMTNSRYDPDPTKHLMWIFHKEIDDAFGGKNYGDFGPITFKGEDRPRGGACFIYPVGQETIVCDSEQEFDALALKYFGIAP